MKQNDRVENFIAYIEKVARPGMKVVFMVRYPVDGLRWSKAICDGISLANSYAWANCKKSLPGLNRVPGQGNRGRDGSLRWKYQECGSRTYDEGRRSSYRDPRRHSRENRPAI
jgi:hypothetical protein